MNCSFLYRKRVNRYLTTALSVAFALSYWVLFAYANNMVFVYRNSIYPLLQQTGTPNPFFFFHDNNFVSVYDSGMEWFPTGHIILMLLIGDTFFSVVLTVLVTENTALMVRSYRAGLLGTGKLAENPAFWLSVLTALFALSPLDTLGVILIRHYYSSEILEILVTDYTYITNTFNAIVLLLTLISWRRLIEGGRANHAME
ncbi:MAG: hypothetical protein M1117_00865 [Candidatus Thermoplasmatota archaeon]|nr:hypothetical protein [Candidatus Thermoplasmatota archaeon]